MPIRIPDTLAEGVRRFRGADGSGWIVDLSDLVADLARRWRLTLGEPIPYATINYVAPATRASGEPCVLKVGFLLDELADEMRALRVCDGRGTVRLLDCDREKGALLMERAAPGTGLCEIADDEQACEISAHCMRDIWRPACDAPGAVTVTKWAVGLERMRRHFADASCPIPWPLVSRAETIFVELERESDHVLLHGDLHHFNIVRAERATWLVIDPKGVTGARAYEVGPFIANRCEASSDPVRSHRTCLNRLSAELGLDRSLLAECCLAHAVLSAWWTIEDTGELGPWDPWGLWDV